MPGLVGSVKPGAACSGTGVSAIRLTSEVGTLAGIPETRGGACWFWCGRSAITAKATVAAATSPAAMTASTTSRVPRRCVGGGLRSAAASCMDRILVRLAGA